MHLLPIYTYPVMAIVFPVVFRLINRKLTWFSIVCAVIIEVIMYWDEFCYYESRGLMIYFTLIQIVIMSIFCILLNIRKKQR